MFVDGALEIHQHSQTNLVEGIKPICRELAEWGGIQIMQLGSTAPKGDDEIGLPQEVDVLRDRLPGHRSALAKLGKSLSISTPQTVEHHSSCGIGQGVKNCVHIITQPFGCIFVKGPLLPG